MAEANETRPDRRVQRTHRLLREALIALVLERGWDAITVQDICERADVGRSTFYSHFGDKEALLTSGFESLRRELEAYVGREGGPGRLAFVEPLLAHCQENRRIFRALIGQRSHQVVQRKFRALLLEMVKEDLGDEVPELVAHFVTGALLELIAWWLDMPAPWTPEELAARYRRLATAAIGVDYSGPCLTASRLLPSASSTKAP